MQTRAREVTSGTTNSLAFTSANTAGNLIVVYVVWNNTGAVSLSDTRGNTYAARPAHPWGNGGARRYSTPNMAAADNTVTATFATAYLLGASTARVLRVDKVPRST